MPTPQMDWNQERDAELTKWVAEGKSRGWIARQYHEMGMHHCTRNMVVGRIYRLKLISPYNNSHLPGKRRKKNPMKALIDKIKKDRSPPPWLTAEIHRIRAMGQRRDLNAPEPLLIPTGDLTFHHCKDVITGQTGDHCEPLYCGHHSPDGRWCDYHHAKYMRKYIRRAR